MAAHRPRDRIPGQQLRAEDLTGLPSPPHLPSVPLSRGHRCIAVPQAGIALGIQPPSCPSKAPVTSPTPGGVSGPPGWVPGLLCPPSTNKLATSMISLIPLFQCCLSPKADLTPHLLASLPRAPHHLRDKITAPGAGARGRACSGPDLILLSEQLLCLCPAPCPHTRGPWELEIVPHLPTWETASFLSIRLS